MDNTGDARLPGPCTLTSQACATPRPAARLPSDCASAQCCSSRPEVLGWRRQARLSGKELHFCSNHLSGLPAVPPFVRMYGSLLCWHCRVLGARRASDAHFPPSFSSSLMLPGRPGPVFSLYDTRGRVIRRKFWERAFEILKKCWRQNLWQV